MRSFKTHPFIISSILIIITSGSISIGTVYCKHLERSNYYQKQTLAFGAQVNFLGETLEPGGVGAIHVADNDADELVLLPAYCSYTELQNSFLTKRSSLIDKLFSISRDDRACPALVWLRNERILSINPVNFKVGIHLTPRIWRLQGSREILLRKESKSPNGFLSIRFDL